MVRRICQTDLDDFIWVDQNNATTLSGLFAASDVTTSFGEQILIAIGDDADPGACANRLRLVMSYKF